MISPSSPTARPLLERVAAPKQLAVPPPRSELVWRPLVPQDLDSLFALVTECETHDDPPYRTTKDELWEDVYVGPGKDPSNNTLAAISPAGDVLAYGRARVLPGDERTVRAFLGGGVHPEIRRRGLGSDLLTWQTGRARQLLAESGKDLPGRIATYVEDGMTDQVAVLTAAGFAPKRYYTEMRRDLSREIPRTKLDASLTLEPWRAELDDQVRLAHNEAFADHWGSEPLTPETWMEGAQHFAPQWSFIVMDRSTDRTRVAGYLISGRYERDWPALGYTVGYSDLLGVRREWRGRQVATALLTAAMSAYAKDGMQYAGLGVDTDNPSGAFGLYERLGYDTTRGSALYSIEI